MAKVVSQDILVKTTTEVLQAVADNLYEFESYTDEEIDTLFSLTPEEAQKLTDLIADTVISQYKLWSSKKVNDELTLAKSECNDYTDQMLSNISSITIDYVDALPATGDTSTIYILKATDGSSKDTLNLYNATSGWTVIGDFEISLDNYYNKTEIDGKLDLKADKTEILSQDDVLTDTSLASTTNVLSAKTAIDELDKKANVTDVVDNLTSTDTDKPLSANQGKVLKGEVDLKANDDEVVKKTDILSANSDTVTDEQVYSAFVMNNILSKKEDVAKILGGTIDVDTVTENIKGWSQNLTGTTPDGLTAGWFENEYMNSTTINQKFISYYKVMYIRSMFGGTWSSWKRVCTTSVADVGVTNVSLNSSIVTSGSVSYCVINGICYIRVSGLVFSTTGNSTIISISDLPKPKLGLTAVKAFSDTTDTAVGLIYIDSGKDLKLRCHITKSGLGTWCNMTYPVAES